MRGGGPDPDSLDPQKARGFEAQSILRDLCEGLTTLDAHAAVAPGVANRWSVSGDGLTYTFDLRHEAQWSNGDRVVAADIVAGLTRLVDPATASAYAQYIDVIANASDIVAGRKPPGSLGVAAPDDWTVVITLATPAPYLPTLLSHPSTCPVHRPTLLRHPDGFARAGIMVGNGAFVLKEWVPGSYMLAARNRYYWNDAATRLEAVKYLLIPDENAELARYRGGELQITFVVPRGQFDWIRANLADQLHVSPQLTTYYYGFNLRRAPFKDNPKLRRALSLVIDREKLAQLVLRVGELPAYGWVPPGVDNYTSQSFDYRSEPLSARIAEAQRLYREAGYSRDRPLSFELRYNSGEVHTKLAIAIASMWKEALGAEVRPHAGGVQVAPAGHRSRRRGDVPLELGGRLQRRLHLRPVPEERLRGEPPALQQPELRRAAHQRSTAAGPAGAQRAAGGGRAGDARRSSADPAVLLRQQAPGEAGGPGLVRQRHERRLQQGPGAREPGALTPAPCCRAVRSTAEPLPTTTCGCDVNGNERSTRAVVIIGGLHPGLALACSIAIIDEWTDPDDAVGTEGVDGVYGRPGASRRGTALRSSRRSAAR